MIVFKVIKAGILTTLQDNGRFGYLKNGISESGALDEHAYRWGNYLLGNPSNSASLEISIGQCELLALTAIDIAVTGADFGFSINDNIAPTWQVIHIKIGDKLQWIKPNSGIRAYLSITAGFDGECYLNSRSVNLTEHTGQKIIDGQTLNALITQAETHQKTMVRHFIPDYQAPLALRIIFNYNEEFKEQDYEKFSQQIFQISTQNNRSAYQLSNSNVKPLLQKYYSQANCYGSVQITPDGTPIIMMRDRPTIGGYPKIGTVFSLDLAQLAQRSTKELVFFQAIKVDELQNLRKQFDNFFMVPNA